MYIRQQFKIGVVPEGLIYNECVDVECTCGSSLSGVIPEGLIYQFGIGVECTYGAAV